MDLSECVVLVDEMWSNLWKLPILRLRFDLMNSCCRWYNFHHHHEEEDDDDENSLLYTLKVPSLKRSSTMTKEQYFSWMRQNQNLKEKKETMRMKIQVGWRWRRKNGERTRTADGPSCVFFLKLQTVDDTLIFFCLWTLTFHD